MNPVLEDIYRTGKYVDLAGRERKVTGGVPREDALILQEMVRFVKAKTTLETGVAFGLSTLAICEALKEARPSTDYIARPRRPQPNPMEPQMNADEHRLSPDPSPSIASPRVALDDGL
ncbi:MAG: hypothetical protein NTX53_21360, partial [candidate division WOR-3 bacterium]|nr:hypothetical protein [candidate division WOR-3 bacterium]